MKRNLGENINYHLRQFNAWFDAFILEAAKPLAILGFTMGTVDIYTRGGLATLPAFAVPWSVVQALTIDGLFFAVWWRFFGAIWTKKTALTNIGLFLIGMVLSAVATLTNMILGFQQLWGVSDSQAAMIRLGIDPVLFTVTRAVLVVAVTVMVSFTYFKSHSTAQHTSQESTTHSTPESTTTVHEVTMSVQGSTVGVSRSTAQSTGEHTESTQRAQLLLPPGTAHDTLRTVLAQHLAEGTPINLKDVARGTGISYDRVRKLAPGIKRELEEEA